MEPVFILGAPRSGTTFLASLLKATCYGKPFETQFITKFYKRLPEYGALDEKENFNRLIEDILSERAVQQWKLKLDLDSFYRDQKGDFSYASIVNNLCMSRNGALGLSAWGDKTPHYIGNFEIIYKLFPQAKFIYIVRDGRDVALSLLKKNWGPKNIYACAKLWKRLNKYRKEFETLEDNRQLIRLSYERLLDNVEGNAARIYGFLQQDYNETELKKFCSTVKPGNYHKWKSQFNKRQLKVFDSVAADTLTRFGYESFSPECELNFISRLGYNLHNKMFHLIFLFETNIIDTFKIRFLGKEPFAE